MTREEAIASIKTLCNTCELFPKCVNEKPECFQAIEMAIQALEQPEPCNLPQLGATYEDGDKLDEAIRLEERAAEAYSEAHNQFHDNVDPADAECCLNRAARHRQLASWLRELKERREQGGI